MIAVYGDNCLDIYQRPRGQFVGGNAVNVAVHLAHLGATVGYFGTIGDDEAGAVIRAAIAARGVDCSHLGTRSGDSAVTWIEVRQGERLVLGDRVGVQCPQTLSTEDLRGLAAYRFIHASAYTAWNIDWRDACPRIVEELETLHDAGAHLSLDFSEQDEPNLAKLAGKYLRVAFVSRGADATESDINRTLRFFHCCGIQEVVVTLGSTGSYYSSPAEHFHTSAHRIQPVDTLGAGDAFIAGWLFHRARAADPRSIMEAATALATDVCGYFGAWPQPRKRKVR